MHGAYAVHEDNTPMTFKQAIVTICASALLATSAVGATLEQDMQAAIHREVVVGDLKGAIAQFEKVASATKDRRLAAKALMHAAACYEKLGAAKAREYYQRIARDYADQTDAAGKARAWLNKAGGEVAERSVTARRLWAGEDVDTEGGPSPDGRYLTFVDWTTRGNIAIRDLSTGEKRLLTRDAGPNFGYNSVFFSQDGKQVAYQWCCNNELRVSNADGSNVRVLHKDPNISLMPTGWSPDGKRLAAIMVNYADRTNSIVLVAVSNGSIQRLKSGNWSWPNLGGFSPDGRFLAYSVAKSASSPGSVSILSVDGTTETTAVEGPAEYRTPAWSPTGDTLVFPSDRSGVMALWAVRVRDGKPQGGAELLKSAVGDIIAMGFSRDGSYFYGTRDRQQHVYVADFDVDTLSLRSEPQMLSNECVGCNSGSAFSPDGKHVAFARTVGQQIRFVVKSVADGKERVLSADFEQPYFAARNGIQWIDSRRFLIVDTSKGMRVFWAVDATTGEKKLIMNDVPRAWPPSAFSPDGKFMYYSASDLGEGQNLKLRLVRRNLETGEERILHQAQSIGIGFFGIAVSPSGDRISFSANTAGAESRSLYVMPSEGGSVREIYKGTYEDPRPASATWSKDGRHIIAATVDPSKRNALWKAYPVDDGEPKIIDPKVRVERLFSPSLSPEGNRLVFAGARAVIEVWVLRNLLPETHASR
jgi:Tol biopolymer transport system component